MSHYTTTELQVKDPASFVEALLECWQDANGKQLTRADIEIHDTPQNLRGYMGDTREQRANIIIRKSKVGAASNDIGFLVQDGKCTAFISEYDKSRYSPKWQKSVMREYSQRTVTKKAGLKKLKTETFINAEGKKVVRVIHQR